MPVLRRHGRGVPLWSPLLPFFIMPAIYDLPPTAHFATNIVLVSKCHRAAAAITGGRRGTGVNHAARFTDPAIGEQGGASLEECYCRLHSRVVAHINSIIGVFSLCNHENAPSYL